jgi:putative sterol carrier protein
MKLSYVFFSQEWAQNAIDNVNADKAFFKASQGFDSSFLFTVYADPARGVKEDLYVFNQLSKGKAGGVEAGVKKQADMNIAGSYDVWKEVVEGNKDPIKAIMNKELVFEGDLKKVMKYMKAVKLLMDNVQKVPTDWHTK